MENTVQDSLTKRKPATLEIKKPLRECQTHRDHERSNIMGKAKKTILLNNMKQIKRAMFQWGVSFVFIDLIVFKCWVVRF